jgi:hypothetical protein
MRRSLVLKEMRPLTDQSGYDAFSSEADIGRDPARQRERIEVVRLGHLMDEAALRKDAQEIGFEFAHGLEIVNVLGRRLAPAGPLV